MTEATEHKLVFADLKRQQMFFEHVLDEHFPDWSVKSPRQDNVCTVFRGPGETNRVYASLQTTELIERCFHRFAKWKIKKDGRWLCLPFPTRDKASAFIKDSNDILNSCRASLCSPRQVIPGMRSTTTRSVFKSSDTQEKWLLVYKAHPTKGFGALGPLLARYTMTQSSSQSVKDARSAPPSKTAGTARALVRSRRTRERDQEAAESPRILSGKTARAKRKEPPSPLAAIRKNIEKYRKTIERGVESKVEALLRKYGIIVREEPGEFCLRLQRAMTSSQNRMMQRLDTLTEPLEPILNGFSIRDYILGDDSDEENEAEEARCELKVGA